MYNPDAMLPLLWISLASMAGMFLAAAVQAPTLTWAILAVLGLVATLAARRLVRDSVSFHIGFRILSLRPGYLILGAAAVTGMFVGAARYQWAAPIRSPEQISFYNDAGYDVLVTGTLAEPPDARDTYTNMRVQVDSLDFENGPQMVRGLILARTSGQPQLTYGSRVRVRGRLETPPSNEEFSYREYLARQGIHSYMPSAEVTLLPGVGGNLVLRQIYAWKAAALRNVYRLFLDPEASLLAGILLGVDTGLPARLQQAFKDTGTAHIIAISGFNIAVIAGVLAYSFNRLLGARLGAVLAGAGIVLYTVFVGADPPVFRAAVMGLIGLLAIQLGRRQVGINTLAATAALMAFVNPFFLWDVGFQLSVLATLGLIQYGGPFMDATRTWIDRMLPSSEARGVISAAAQFVVLTFAAQLTTLPIMAYHFRQLSLVSLLANAFILPVQPAVMVLGGAAVFVSLFVYPVGQALAWAATPVVTYTIALVELFDRVPHAVIYLGGFSLAAVAIFYAVLLGVTLGGSNLSRALLTLKARAGQVGIGMALLALLGLALLVWRLVDTAPDGRLHVTFMDVGAADAVYIEGPTGGRVLVNGGPSAIAVSNALGRRLSPFDHHLDWLVVASADEDQVAALPTLLPRFPPTAVLLGAPEESSFASSDLMERLRTNWTPVTDAEVGQLLQLGDGATLKVIDVSSRGTTLLIEWHAFRVLLPVGANLDTLDALELGQQIGPVDVLLLSQSGYAPLAPPEWLSNLNPRLVVISVDAANREGLPSSETLAALEDYAVLRTDVNGWIGLSTDGNSMWVTSERTTP